MGFAAIGNRGFRVVERAGAGGVGWFARFALRLLRALGRAFAAIRGSALLLVKWCGATDGPSVEEGRVVVL